MHKAIIFDFDGVIVSSDRPRFHALQKSAEKCNLKITDKSFKKIIGKTTNTFLNEILSESQKPLIPSIIKEYEKKYKNNIELLTAPNDIVTEFIRSYTGSLLFAIASTSSRIVIEKLLHKFGIYSKIKIIISREDVIKHKPLPEIYFKAAKKLNLSVKECVAIEDSIIGVEAALASGMPCYVFPNGINKKNDFKNKAIMGFITTRESFNNIVEASR